MTTTDAISGSMGGGGIERVSDTAVHTAATGRNYINFHAVAACVVAAVTVDSNYSVVGTLAALPLAAGDNLTMTMRSFQLTSGDGYLTLL